MEAMMVSKDLYTFRGYWIRKEEKNKWLVLQLNKRFRKLTESMVFLSKLPDGINGKPKAGKQNEIFDNQLDLFV